MTAAQPANPPARAGEKITVVDVPRLTGVGYYAATARGMREAAAELGTVSVKSEAPAQISINQQITLIDNHVTSGVDGAALRRQRPDRPRPRAP